MSRLIDRLRRAPAYPPPPEPPPPGGTPGHREDVAELERRVREVEDRLALYGLELETHRRILRARGEEV